MSIREKQSDVVTAELTIRPLQIPSGVNAAGENGDLLRDIEQLFVDPETWLNTPHPELKEHKPREFLKAGRQQPLRDLVAAIKYGLFA